MKLTIREIKVYHNKQDGTPLVTKNGNPYKSVAIVAEEEVLGAIGSKIYVNDFSNETEDWREGTVVELSVEKVDKNGKTYINGRLPKSSGGVSKEEFDNLKLLAEQALNLANTANKRIDEMTKTPMSDNVKSLADEVGLDEDSLPF